MFFVFHSSADIAEKLHGVMEAQWQQALAILTTPSQNSIMQSSDTEASESPELNNARMYPETPKSSKSQRSNNTEKNNLDVVGKRDPPRRWTSCRPTLNCCSASRPVISTGSTRSWPWHPNRVANKANQRAEVATVSLHLGSADNERCFRQVIFYLVIPVVF